MITNFEKEVTYNVSEEKIKQLVHRIFYDNFYICDTKYIPNKVKISSAVHFYFAFNSDDKYVYKFKEYQGDYILNRVKKTTVQSDNNIVNVERIEKDEYYDDNLDFDNVLSTIFKERMTVFFENKDLKISFDRVVGFDYNTLNQVKNAQYYLEIEYNNVKDFDTFSKEFLLEKIEKPKYLLGIYRLPQNLRSKVRTVGIKEYLKSINKKLNTGFFENINKKYYYNNRNIELELKIKDYDHNVEHKLISDLKQHFEIVFEDENLIHDEYYDYDDMLYNNKLSYRIRNAHNNQRKNLFFKVPNIDKGIFSSRIEYMSKFQDYTHSEILQSKCNANLMVNKYFNFEINQKLKSIATIDTKRKVYLVLNREKPQFLIGMLSFDNINYTANDNNKITLKEIEFELYNNCLLSENYSDIYDNICKIFGNYKIDNRNKYVYAKDILRENT